MKIFKTAVNYLTFVRKPFLENASAWKKRDGRKLNRQAREALRLLAVQRVEAGESPEAVDQPLGFHRSSIYVWLAIYREHGLNGLRSKPIPAVRPN